jgi:hypothetical protein
MRGLLALLGIKVKGKARNVRAETIVGPITHYVFENKRQPDGWGANRYAFETLALPPFSPINRAVRTRRQILYPFQGQQIWASQAVKVAPIPAMSGGIFTGGMLQADGSLPDLGFVSTVDMRAVRRNDPTASANDASEVWGPNDPIGD